MSGRWRADCWRGDMVAVLGTGKVSRERLIEDL
jgi:hypothetical protein